MRPSLPPLIGSTSADVIRFSLSGGPANTDPNLSIGGDCSTRYFPDRSEIFTAPIDYLFGDSSIVFNHRDYRCIFLINDSDSVLKQVQFLITNSTKKEFVLTGTDKAVAIERVSIPKPVTGGYIILGWELQTFRFESLPIDPAAWADNFKWAMRRIRGLESVNVSWIPNSSNYIFEVAFFEDYRQQKPLLLIQNGLNERPVITISIESNGGPINSTPFLLPVGTVSPDNVIFGKATDIGTLYPNDSVPVWIERSTPVNEDFTLDVVGNILK